METTGIHWGRMAIAIGAAAALYMLGHLAVDPLVAYLDMHVRAANEPMLHRTIMTATAAYIILMSIPFMPGVEIGLSMLMVFGSRVALLVYLSTVAALTLAYLAGRLLPPDVAARLFSTVGLSRAGELVRRLEPLSADQRMSLLVQRSPPRWIPWLLRHRYLALAVLLNLPGNMIIGGGGGIALLAGMTRLFPFPVYLLTIVVAVAPVPLIISFMD